ncbi:hypothetical protein EMN47_10310 [Prolixibacteraceae bacterium JC049]|nr:hypothetical protein [Prolixibacteraceae bacterium JC049]
MKKGAIILIVTLLALVVSVTLIPHMLISNSVKSLITGIDSDDNSLGKLKVEVVKSGITKVDTGKIVLSLEFKFTNNYEKKIQKIYISAYDNNYFDGSGIIDDICINRSEDKNENLIFPNDTTVSKLLTQEEFAELVNKKDNQKKFAKPKPSVKFFIRRIDFENETYIEKNKIKINRGFGITTKAEIETKTN